MIKHGRSQPNSQDFIDCFSKWRLLGLKNPPAFDAKANLQAADLWCEQAIQSGFCQKTVHLAREEVIKSCDWYPDWRTFASICLKVGPDRYFVAKDDGAPVVLIEVDSWMKQEQVQALKGGPKAIEAGTKALETRSKYAHLSDDDLKEMAEAKMKGLFGGKRI